MGEKSSKQESARLSNIKKLLELEEIDQKDLADAIDREPQNLNRDMVHDKISDKTCKKIADAFPKYNHLWLLGYSDIMFKEEYEKALIRERDSINDAAIIILEAAYHEVCSREGLQEQTLDNITELLLLEAQLRDFADSLMWNYVKHRERSHVWGYLDQLDKKK